MTKQVKLTKEILLKLAKKKKWDLDSCKEEIRDEGCWYFAAKYQKELGIKSIQGCDCGGGDPSCDHAESITI